MSLALKLDHVTKSFVHEEQKIDVLNEISLEVASASTVSLMGQSGCGKSTLINIIAGLDQPTSGQVWLNEKNLRQLSATELNRYRASHVGIIFQQFHLVDYLSAFENVRLPLDLNQMQDPDARAQEMLARVGLSHRANHLPNQLSRGECQRIAIARVLVMKPNLVLADEPTGSLDTKTGGGIVNLIFDLVGQLGAALFLVTHDPAIARLAGKNYRMVDGRLLAVQAELGL